MMLKLTNLFAAFFLLFDGQQRRIRRAKQLSESEMVSHLTHPQRLALTNARYIAKELGYTSVKQMKFFEYVLSSFLYNSKITGMEKSVADLILDVDTPRKKVVNAILAYEVYRGGYQLNDIRKLQTLATYAEYKRPINLEQQVERLLKQLREGDGK